MHGGDMVAAVLRAQGVPFLFTLCGGHISPVLVAAKARDIRVVDCRHEATAVFAADAVARLTGRPGVAVVTAGPGVTNTLTALTNARLAQSPVVLLGGAAATVLQGRGALQDVEHVRLVTPHVKAALAVGRVREIVPVVEEAFRLCQDGVPGPVFVELPIDVLYERSVVEDAYGAAGGSRSLSARLVRAYLRARVRSLFRGAPGPRPGGTIVAPPPVPDRRRVAEAARTVAAATRPVLLVGSQAVTGPDAANRMVPALERIGAPVYLSGTARGLLGREHPLQLRHARREALREADVVVLVGVPADFRLDYGRQIRRGARLVSINRSRVDLRRNRRPDVPVLGDAALALTGMAGLLPPAGPDRTGWHTRLRERDRTRDAEIAAEDSDDGQGVHPVRLCREIAAAVPPGTVLVGDGGDVVATASYVLRPDGPLRWLDPGVFGTLGVGAGFGLAAALVHPGRPVWIVFGDGALGYSLTEFDTFVRHGLPVVGIVGNDAAWSQIAREQVPLLKDDVATVLAPTRYDLVAAGFGAEGRHVAGIEELPAALAAAARADRPMLVDVRTSRSDFRRGSVSM